jgi:hypothetical protein
MRMPGQAAGVAGTGEMDCFARARNDGVRRGLVAPVGWLRRSKEGVDTRLRRA